MYRYYQKKDKGKWNVLLDSEVTAEKLIQVGAKKVSILAVSQVVDEFTKTDELSYKGPLYFDIDCKEDIYTAAKLMMELEENYIDKMFEMGDIENLKAYDLKQFVRKRTNEKLQELGYSDKRRFFQYDKDAAANLDWFYHLTGGHTHTDFFAIRPTDYSKANEGEDFEDIW